MAESGVQIWIYCVSESKFFTTWFNCLLKCSYVFCSKLSSKEEFSFDVCPLLQKHLEV